MRAWALVELGDHEAIDGCPRLAAPRTGSVWVLYLHAGIGAAPGKAVPTAGGYAGMQFPT
jgi:hypothetical protein